MNTQPAKQLSIFNVFAAERHMEKEALIATLFKTIAPKEATMEDLVGFLQIAHRFQLDPWAKEIFLIKSKGRVSTYVSVDGYARIVNREPTYDGAEFTYDQDDNGKITACTCSMYRKDRGRPIVVTEFYDECAVPDSAAWQKAPGRMLRHRAFVQAARLAFGISGALDEGVSDVPPTPTLDLTSYEERPEPPRPTPKKTPPSPGQGVSQNWPRQESSPQPAPMSETKVEDQADAEDVPTGGFPLRQLLDDMATAKTVDELKAIYTDYEVDDGLDNYPDALNTAQDAFIANQNRIERR